MADLTAVQLAWLRDELGAEPPDVDLQASYDQRGSIRDVAISEWRKRRTAFTATAMSVSVPGVVSVNVTENVKAIDRRIEALLSLDDDPTSDPGEDQDGGVGRVTVTQLRRTRGR